MHHSPTIRPETEPATPATAQAEALATLGLECVIYGANGRPRSRRIMPLPLPLISAPPHRPSEPGHPAATPLER